MKTRYCDTRLHRELMPCDGGWGSMDNQGIKSCMDEPALENCHNLVDPSNLHCPYCNSWIENPFDDVMGIPSNDPRLIRELGNIKDIAKRRIGALRELGKH